MINIQLYIFIEPQKSYLLVVTYLYHLFWICNYSLISILCRLSDKPLFMYNYKLQLFEMTLWRHFLKKQMSSLWQTLLETTLPFFLTRVLLKGKYLLIDLSSPTTAKGSSSLTFISLNFSRLFHLTIMFVPQLMGSQHIISIPLFFAKISASAKLNLSPARWSSSVKYPLCDFGLSPFHTKIFLPSVQRVIKY